MMTTEYLLKIENLRTYFKLPKKSLFAPTRKVHAVDDISFEIPRGKTFGLVGESGCGKSTTALSILRLVAPTSGRVLFNGIDILQADSDQLRDLRQRMQIIFQDPYSSLNPRAVAGDIVAAPLKNYKVGLPAERAERVVELFSKVGLKSEQRAAFPHQFSGGQRQRINIARALALNTELIVCDEPVSALDVAIQAQILNLLVRLQKELNLTYLFISHDMAVIQHICDVIAVLYMGKIVEQADRSALFADPFHPYTWSLLSAIPSIDAQDTFASHPAHLKGDPPNPIDPPPGCRFAPRCPFAKDTADLCQTKEPPLREVDDGHKVACHQVSYSGVPPHDRVRVAGE